MTPVAFDTQHEDLIHDAQMDYYGRRLATGSSDRTVRIFQVEPNQPEKFLCSLTGYFYSYYGEFYIIFKT
jgi:protein transport protein SEC13